MNEAKIFEYVLQNTDQHKLTEMLTNHRLCGITASDIEAYKPRKCQRIS